MIFFLINPSAILSVFSAPFGAAASSQGAMMSARAQQAAMQRASAAERQKEVDGQPHIPRVKRK